jgi:hypothetical protein
LSLGDRLGNIESSETGSIFDDIGIPVITGANNIKVFFFNA